MRIGKLTLGTLFLGILLLGLGKGAVFVVPLLRRTTPPHTLSSGNQAVLGEATSLHTFLKSIAYNVPVIFNKDITVSGSANFTGDVVIKGRNLVLDGGSINGGNLVKGLSPGTGITLGPGESPTITNTGVLSLGGQTGAVTLSPGTGIAVSGTTITNTGVTSVQGTTGAVTFTAGAGLTLKGTDLSQSIATDLTPNGVVYASGPTVLASLSPGASGYVLQSNGSAASPSWVAPTAIFSGTVSFANILTGSNTNNTLTLGDGSSLTTTGTGVINATQLSGGTWASPGGIGSTTPGTGAFTTLSGTTVTGATFDGLTITPNSSNTLTIASGKTLRVNNTLTLTGTDATAFALPGVSDTLAGVTAAQTLTNKTLAANANTITGLSNANLSGAAGITNANLANSSVTINAAGPLTGGGVVSLGSVLSLSCPTCTVSGGNLFTAAATSGSNSTIAQGGTLTLAAGSNITTTNNGLGVITFATSTTPSFTTVNGLTLPNNGSNTLNIAAGKTFTANNSLTFSGTDGTTFTLPSVSDTLVGRTSTDTLTNKTISAASNTIAGLTNTNLSGTAGITNANLANPSLTVTAGTGLSGGGSVALGSTITLANTGVLSLAGTPKQVNVSGATGNVTLSLPQDLAATSSPGFASLALTGAVTSGTWNGSVVGTQYGGTGQNWSSVLQGNLPYFSSTGTLNTLSPGTANQLLVTGGSGANPSFANVSSLLTAGTDIALSGTTNATIANTSTLSSVTGRGASTNTALTLNGGVTVNSAATLSGNVTLGTNSSNTITPNGQFNASLIPTTTSVNLGSVANNFGTLYANNLVLNGVSGSGGFIQRNSGVVSPTNITDDLAIGGISTQSAKFQVSGTTGNASSSATQFLFTNSAGATIGTQVQGYWTLNGNTYLYRRQVTVTNNSSTQTLPLNYGVTLTASGATASDLCTNTRTDNNDVRTSYNATEINRNITRTCATTVTIQIQTQATIAASGSDANYYLYYGSATLASSGSGFTLPSNTQIDSMDNTSSWTSTDNTNFAISQETTVKNEGTGSLKGVQTAQPTTGDAGAWNTGLLPQLLAHHTTVSTTVGGTTYLYTIGGFGGSAQSTVYKTQLDSSGTIGTWSTTSQGQLPQALYYHTTAQVTVGGTTYLYTIGGFGGSAQSTVYKTQLDSSGNIGTWSTTSQAQLPTALSLHTTAQATIGGTTYLYTIGGSANGIDQSTVYKAQVDTSGNIGTWATTSQGQLPQVLEDHTTVPVTISGTTYLYTIGGLNGSGPVYQSTVYKAQVDSSGNVGAWSTTSQGQLPQAIRFHTTVPVTISGTTYLYTIGGYNGSTYQSTVYKAQLDSSGTIGVWSTTSQGQLPGKFDDHSTVPLTVGGTTYLYTIGGYNGSTYQATQYRALVDSSGNVGTWNDPEQGQLPQTLYSHTTVPVTISGTTYLYTIGGFNGAYLSTVYKAQINSSGAVGAWSTTSQGQLPQGLYSHATVPVTVSGTTYLYTIGGVSIGPTLSTVYKAQVDSSGNVGAWSTTSQGQLPQVLYSHTTIPLTVSGTTYLYTIGGYSTSNGGYQSAVYRAQIAISGDVGAWSTTSQGQLPQALDYHTTVPATVGGTTYFYTIGGNNAGAKSTVYKAQVDGSGNIGTWSTTSQGQLPQILRYHTTVPATVGGTTYFYTIGGYNAGDRSTVYKAQLDSSGNIGTWSTTSQGQLPQILETHTTVPATVSGTTYLYTIGGYNGSANQSTVYRSTISQAPPYQATKTIASADWSGYQGLSIQTYSSRTGTYMNLEFSNDGGATWQANPITVNSANTWETKTFNLSGLSSNQKNTVTQYRINVTDSSAGFTAYYDDIEGLPFYFTDTAPTLAAASVANAATPNVNLGLAAQGTTGTVNLNYSGSGTAGSGGLNLYNGSTTSIFSVDGSGNASGSGNLTFAGVNGSTLKFLGGSPLTIQTSPGGNAGLTTKLTLTSGGLLGLGTTSPLGTLDVRAQSGTLPSASVSGNTAFAGLVVDNSGIGDLFTASSSGLNRFVIQQGGNVGIGTTTPGALLHVSGGNFLMDNAQFISFKDSGGTIRTSIGWTSSNVLQFLNNASAGTMQIGLTNTNVSASTNAVQLLTRNTERMRIAANGEIGIGTTTPLGQTGLDLERNTVNEELLVNQAGTGAIFTASQGGNLKFTINNSGLVGINAGSPLATLDVRGQSGTLPVASVSGKTALASLIANNDGIGDLFTASSSSITKFSIAGNGNVQVFGGALCVRGDQASCNSGNPLTAGSIYATNTTVQSADVAENYISSQTLEPGDVVMPASDGDSQAVTRTTSAYQAQAIGVVSTSPGVTLNSDALTDITHPNKYPIALQGRVPVKVSSINGDIHTGDALTSSSIPGIAMKATRAGQIIGKALANFAPSDPQAIGKIMVFVNISWSDPNMQIALTDTGDLSINGPIAGNTVPQAPQPSGDNATPDQLATLSTAVSQLRNQAAFLAASMTTSVSAVADLTSRVTALEKALPENFALTNASDSASFTGSVVLSTDLSVIGKTTVGDLGITGRITDGVLDIEGLDASGSAAISTMSGPLKIQSLALGGVDFENGRVTIDTNGNLITVGDITAKAIHADEAELGKLKIKEGGDTASVGEATIPVGQTSVIVKTSALTDKSKIFVEPEDTPVTTAIKKTGPDGFTIKMQQLQSTDIKLNWWIIN